VLKDRVNRNSAVEGYSTSRLPQFTPEEVVYIRGTYMFTENGSTIPLQQSAQEITRPV
jgi:hypothetical protein